jgi:ubiquinone/menaquinone biosynthesis C-methylase UbiE
MVLLKKYGKMNAQEKKPGRWYMPGVLYDALFERPLRWIRKKVREIVTQRTLFPLLDICCGPGAQLSSLADLNQPIFGLDINLRLMKYASARRRGIPFICADATHLPFHPSAFKAVIISFALHEKEPELRRLMLAAAREVLAPGGCLVMVDFEKPWDPKSRRAFLYISVIERLVGREHFRRNRDFLRRGGLRVLLAEDGLAEVSRQDIAAGTCAIVIATP